MGESERRTTGGRKAGESKGDMQVVWWCCVAVFLKWCLTLGVIGKWPFKVWCSVMLSEKPEPQLTNVFSDASAVRGSHSLNSSLSFNSM